MEMMTVVVMVVMVVVMVGKLVMGSSCSRFGFLICTVCIVKNVV